MKITDFCLIFIAITLPIIIVVYINVSYTIKAQEQEMYYKQLINAAIEDATTQMKQIENDDKTIDYGYSGQSDKKVSVNAEIGKEAFFNALYNNFGIKGNDAAERYLQLFVPALLIIDYNGVYTSSIEEFEDKDLGQTVLEHAVKPKKYFAYTYYILNEKEATETEVYEKQGTKDVKVKETLDLYKVVSAREYNGPQNAITSVHTVEFTMDDYITHRGVILGSGSHSSTEIPQKSFYIADTRIGSEVTGEVMSTMNNADLYIGSSSKYDKVNVGMINKIAAHLKSVREPLIIETITNEIAYSVNQNNYYAASTGITYDFVFPVMEEEKMGEFINEIGMLAFVQGLSLGNKYLETEAYSVTRLELVNRYYLSVADVANGSKYSTNLYHVSRECPEYKVSRHENITPSYLITKQQAASVIGIIKKDKKDKDGEVVKGFYPCPICNP